MPIKIKHHVAVRQTSYGSAGVLTQGRSFGGLLHSKLPAKQPAALGRGERHGSSDGTAQKT